MAITIKDAYDRGTAALKGNRDEDTDDYLRSLGIDDAGAFAGEFRDGVTVEVVMAAETVAAEGFEKLPAILLSSFLAGIEWQRGRNGKGE